MTPTTNSAACSGGRRLCAVHDFITRVGFILAACCLALIVFSYCFEVAARYFFGSPTVWASSLVSYLLCAMIFLVGPELSRRNIHIFISIVPDMLPAKYATALQRTTYFAGFAACMLATWFCLDATTSQYVRGILTINEWRIPKWIVSAFIPYGMCSAGLYFLRQALNKNEYKESGVPLA